MMVNPPPSTTFIQYVAEGGFFYAEKQSVALVKHIWPIIFNLQRVNQFEMFYTKF
ncbi:hypothetical protein SAMN05216238_104264 [Lentibacillus persicus]|uniref:Uncharacterized protein n=1 Tax=Lentibacillus persicus TaxID=640948 RepID=A0A1I1VHY7_9BACI|nr:hypothetical protein SAMN05216238_104264 [Lentibacillus persicus]